MKRLFGLLITLTFFYLLIQLGFKFFDKGQTVNYSVGDNPKVSVKEVYSQNYKDEKDNYFFEFSVNGERYTYQTYQDFGKADRIIKDAKYFNGDNLSCIYPIFQTKSGIDIICKKNGIQYFYRDLVGQSSALDEFATSLKDVGYNLSDYQNNLGNEQNISSIIFYSEQIPSDYIVSVEGYKGIFTLRNSERNNSSSVELYSYDVYKKPISSYIDNYYISADYNQEYSFHDFTVVDLRTTEQFKITSADNLSLDGYFQGSVGNNIYYIDRSSKKQYELNIKKKTIKEIGNTEVGAKVYRNKNWEDGSIYNAVSNIVSFEQYKIDNPFANYNYERVDFVGKEKSGFYYGYERVGNRYNVYRMEVQNSTERTFLFQVDNPRNILYLDDYIYFISGDTLYYYHHTKGVQTILTNTEFGFNQDIKVGITRK